MIFGQLVIGPPGSGKSTYCKAMYEFLTGLGRKVVLVNIDPANDQLPYECGINISDLITVEQVMENLMLGPNGGLIYCMEYLEENLDWFLSELNKFSDSYLLIDCPGQVELYVHHKSIHNIFEKLSRSGFSLVAVQLVDSTYCTDPEKFISVVLGSLSTMIQVALPHVNVLSKCDLIEKFGKLHFNLDFYTEVLDLSNIIEMLPDTPFSSKHKKLNKGLADIIESYGLVSFVPLTVESKECMARVLKTVDKANGYIFGVNEEQRNIQSMLSCAMAAEFDGMKLGDVAERYVNDKQSSSSGYISQGR